MLNKLGDMAMLSGVDGLEVLTHRFCVLFEFRAPGLR